MFVNELQCHYEDYENDGFTVFRNVLDSDLIEEVRSHVEWLTKKYPSLRPEHLHHPLIRDDAFWVRLVSDSRLLNIAELFIGPDIVSFTSHYICKSAYDGHEVLWHQDGAYWDLRPMKAVALWVAVDRSEPANGCLQMLPGTHKEPLLAIESRPDSPNMLASTMPFDQYSHIEPVDIILNPGDVSVHHPHIIHGSKKNLSPNRRCGLDIGFIPAGVGVHNEGLYRTPMLLRGKPASGCLYQPWPKAIEGKTISFSGDDKWNKRATEHNASFNHIEQSNENPLETTNRMMERLASTSVKSI